MCVNHGFKVDEAGASSKAKGFADSSTCISSNEPKNLVFNHPHYVALYSTDLLNHLIGEDVFQFYDDPCEDEGDGQREYTYSKKIEKNPFSYAASIIMVVLPNVIKQIKKSTLG